MAGYYKDPVATAKVVDKDGWFDTGDLGFINQGSGDLVLTGACVRACVGGGGVEDACAGSRGRRSWMDGDFD